MTPWTLTSPTLLARRGTSLLALAAGGLLLLVACTPAPPEESASAAPADDEGEAPALLVSPAAPAPDGEAAIGLSAAAPPEPPAVPALVLRQIEVEAQAPELAITSPRHGAGLDESYVLFSGVVEAGATVSSGPYTAEVAPDGRWTLGLVLQPGANVARFTATDADGRTATRAVTVYHTGSEKEHVAAAKGTFTAYQKYGSCGEDPPYDVFSGSAVPGAQVRVTSAYGSGSTVADAKGHWKLRVEFPTAPPGVVFDVVASDGVGSKTLAFYHEGGSSKH